MKILDLQTGRVHEYGENCHDSLALSEDGRSLHYYNLQCGDGSRWGDYRFVCDDNKVPAESKTADALHCEVYFNIGGWHRPRGEWKQISPAKIYECSYCGKTVMTPDIEEYHYCHGCGAVMRKEGK